MFDMSKLALLCALVALAAAALPGVAPFIGVGIALFGIALGWLGFRRRADRGGQRMASVAAASLAGIALALCGARIVLTLLAIAHLQRMAA
jgi:NADH:ubiquinone oxidoreductase subunit 4 (subunit M)